MSSEEITLYERIGGKDTVKRLIDAFYGTVVKDPEIGGFFKDADVEAIRNMQEEFFGAALGGPVEYTGLELTAVHSGRGIKRKHFARYVELLFATLKSLHLEDRDVTEIIDRVNLYVDDIVGSAPTSD